MSSMKDREEGFERKFALDEEQRFRAMARRNKLLGLWAAEKLGKTGDAAWTHAGPGLLTALLAVGPITAVPLLLFAAGARRIPLATLGLLQYISPMLQFVLGVWLLGEVASPARLVGFGLIWAALLCYSVEGLWWQRMAKAT